MIISGVVQPGETYALVASGTGSDGSHFEASFVVETHAAAPLIVTASASPNASQVFEVDGQAEVVMLMSVPAEETRPLVYALHPAAGPFAIDAEAGAMSIVGEVEAGVAYDLVVVVTAEDGTSAVYPMTVQVGLAGGENDGNGDDEGGDAGDGDGGAGDEAGDGGDSSGSDDEDGSSEDDDHDGEEGSDDDEGDSGSAGDAGDDGAGEDGSSGGDDSAGGDDDAGGDDSSGGAGDDSPDGDDGVGGDGSSGGSSDDGVGGEGSSGGSSDDGVGGEGSSGEEDDKSDIPANTGTVPIKVSPVEVSVAEDLFQGMILATVSVSGFGELCLQCGWCKREQRRCDGCCGEWLIQFASHGPGDLERRPRLRKRRPLHHHASGGGQGYRRAWHYRVRGRGFRCGRSGNGR